MKKDEITVECEQSPLIGKIIQNAIKLKKGRKAFLPQRLPKNVFDQLVVFSYKYIEGEEGDGDDQMGYNAVVYCVLQILDFQQNPNKPGEVTADQDTIIDAIGMYCLELQFELIMRTKSIGMTINRPTLWDIFDHDRKIQTKVKGSRSIESLLREIQNVSPKTRMILTNILDKMGSLDDLSDELADDLANATFH